MSSIATHIVDLTGGTLHTVDSLLAAAVPSGASLVSSLNAQLGSTVWQTHPSGSDIVTAVNTALGGTTWQSGGSGTPTFGSLTGAVADNAALVAAFAGKAPSSHTHTLSQITDVTVTSDMVAITKGFRPGLYDDLDSPPVGTIIESVNDGHLYWIHRDGSKHLLCDSGGYGSTSVDWGDITGTLSFQADLQAALDDKQPLNDNLSALAGLASYANTIGYFNGEGTAALTAFENFGRVLVSAADDETARLILDAQQESSVLTSIAGLTLAADKGVYFTGASTAATYTITTAGRALVGNSSASGMRSTLGLVIGTNVQAQSSLLSNIAGVSAPSDAFIYFNDLGVAASTSITTFGIGFVASANAAAGRTALEIPAPHPGFRNNYYYSSYSGYTAAARALVANRMFLLPFFVPKATTFTRIGCNVAVLAASSTIRLGIYNNGNGVPSGAPLLDAGTVSGATTGEKEITISQTLAPGWYWPAVVSDGTAQLTADTNTTLAFRPNMGFATGAGTGYAIMQEDITFGALPSIGSPADGPLSAHPFRIWLRIV